jgi:apolipoprotein N-acyltransferase
VASSKVLAFFEINFMAPVLNRPRLIVAAAGALALSAVGYYFGTGLKPVWWVAWLAPLPLLLFAYRAPALSAAALAFGARVLGGLNAWTFFRTNLEIPLPAAVVLLLLPAVALVPAVLLSRGLLRRGFVGMAAVAFPAAWVSFEYLVSETSPHGTAFNLAYSQADCLPLLQLASLTGVWGVSLVVSVVPAAVAATLSTAGPAAARVRVATAVAVLAAAVFSFGVWRLKQSPPAGETVTIGLAATDVKSRIDPETRAEALETLRLYAEHVDLLAGRGASVIVFPEKIAPVRDAEGTQVTEMFRAAAARNHVTLVVGLTRVADSLGHNVALVFFPDGAPEATYSKHHLVPGFEDRFEPGSDRLVLRGHTPPRGVEICKDMDFPLLSRSYGTDGVGLLLVPAWDFDADRWLHGRMAVTRGVEGGFCVARAAKQGLLTVSDPCGRIVAEAPSDESEFSRLIATVPVSHETTVYVRFGDWAAWLSLATLAAAAALLTRRPKAPGVAGHVS